jgi:3-methylcrotonyl-CoA carboxylase alpha subunit
VSRIRVGEQEVEASPADVAVERLPDGSLRITRGRKVTIAWVDGDDVWIDGRVRRVSPVAGRAAPKASTQSTVTPPMPGAVTRVFVAPGDAVVTGQKLVAISAMKLETVLKAPRDGVVRAVSAVVGAQVKPGQVLVELEPA